MNNANTLSIPQNSLNQASLNQTTSKTPPKKKKCSGTCANCKAKKQARELKKSLAMDLQVESEAELVVPVPTVNESELQGIEFDGKTHKGLWSGSFRGTPDF